MNIKIVLRNFITKSSSLTNLVSQLGYAADESNIKNRLSAIINHNEHCVFAAEIDGEIVGWIHGFIALRVESDPFVEIGGLVVSEAYRKNGIGKALVEKVIDWSKTKQITKIRVRCNTIRDDAHAFYKHIGFEECKEQKIFDFKIGSTRQIS